MELRDRARRALMSWETEQDVQAPAVATELAREYLRMTGDEMEAQIARLVSEGCQGRRRADEIAAEIMTLLRQSSGIYNIDALTMTEERFVSLYRDAVESDNQTLKYLLDDVVTQRPTLAAARNRIVDQGLTMRSARERLIGRIEAP